MGNTNTVRIPLWCRLLELTLDALGVVFATAVRFRARRRVLVLIVTAFGELSALPIRRHSGRHRLPFLTRFALAHSLTLKIRCCSVRCCLELGRVCTRCIARVEG